jgi:hypothetical protein
VRNDILTRLEDEFLVVEEDVDLVRLEGDEVGDACDLRPRLRIGPRCLLAIGDVVVAGQALVRAERLPLDRISAFSVTSWRGAYQRGAKPDSNSTIARVVSATSLSPSLTTRWRALWRMSMR